MVSLMQLSISFFISIFLLITVVGCENSSDVIKISGKTMGTQYHITIVTSSQSKARSVASLKQEIDHLLKGINQQMSTYIPDSEISLFNQYTGEDWFPVSEGLAKVVSAAQLVSQQSSGLFDVTVSPLIDLWGFGAKTQLSLPTDDKINKALENIGYKFLESRFKPPALRKLKKKLRINLSAIAKGYAVDKLAELLTAKEYHNFLVEIGGEIRVEGKNASNKPWQIGIEMPDLSNAEVKEYLLLSDISLATSGDYRNYFMDKGIRYSHTINPITGRPITHNLASVTVLHRSAMMADAYATALSVMGKERAKSFVVGGDHKLFINLITRESEGFKHWHNMNGTTLLHTSEKCKKWGGCN